MNKQEPRADGHIDVENHGMVLVARIDGGPHALFAAALTKQLKELVDRADRDTNIHAVVFTGTHPDRFLSHSDVAWLQQGGVGFPPINTRIAGIVSRMARLINKVPIVRTFMMKIHATQTGTVAITTAWREGLGHGRRRLLHTILDKQWTE